MVNGLTGGIVILIFYPHGMVFSSLRFFPVFPVRFSTLLFLIVFAIIVFIFSVFGEVHFKGGPSSDESLITYVVEGSVLHQNASQTTTQPFTQDLLLEPGLRFTTEESSRLGIFFKNGDLILLEADTEVLFQSIDFSVFPLKVTLELVRGDLWISDLQGVADIEIHTPQFAVLPQYASAEVHYDNDRFDLFAAHHPTRLLFLDPTDSSLTLNDYLITESHQVSIPTAGLSPFIGQLRYTKLVKQYPFRYVDLHDWQSEWTTALQADSNRLLKLRSDFVSMLRREGNSGVTEGTFRYTLNEAYKRLRSFLTFNKNQLMILEDDEDLDLLYQSLYLTMQSQTDESMARLNSFKAASQNFESTDRLLELSHVFQAILWGDAFYSAKEVVRDLFKDPFVALRQRLNEIYDLLDRGEFQDAFGALTDYNSAWSFFIDQEKSALADRVKALIEERQILQNLLYREDSFYRVEAYQVLSQLETHILAFTAEEDDLNEERQAFVRDKIQVLNRLVFLIDDGLVNVKTGSDLAYLLIDEAQELLNDITLKTAVVDYYVSQLNELILKLQYINSSDYALAEGTFDEKFNSYLAKENDLAVLTDYIRGFTQQAATTGITLSEATQSVEKAFIKEGVDFVALVSLGDVDYRLFSIEGGRVGLSDIEGNYDRVTGIVYDLSIEGERFSTGVILSNLVSAVEEFTDSDVSSTTDVDVGSSSSSDELSSVEALSIELIIETLTLEAKLVLIDDGVQVIDLDQAIFQVQAQVVDKGDTIVVDFTYDDDEGLAYAISADRDGRRFDVADTPVVDLNDAVLEAWYGL